VERKRRGREGERERRGRKKAKGKKKQTSWPNRLVAVAAAAALETITM